MEYRGNNVGNSAGNDGLYGGNDGYDYRRPQAGGGDSASSARYQRQGGREYVDDPYWGEQYGGYAAGGYTAGGYAGGYAGQGQQYASGDGAAAFSRYQGASGYGQQQGYQQGYGQQGYGQQQGYQQRYGQAGLQQYGQGTQQQALQQYSRANQQQAYRGAQQPPKTVYDQERRSEAADVQPRRKGRGGVVLAVLLALLLLAALGFGGWFIYDRLNTIAVTLNGQQIELKKGTTVMALLEGDYVSPTPGNLIAIDGSVITTGGGTPYTLTVDGEAGQTDMVLVNGQSVTIGDGQDVSEDVIVTQEVIPCGYHNDSTSFSSYWNGSIHLLSDGSDGLRTTWTGAVSGISQWQDTVLAIDGGYHTYTTHTDELVIALTFDDGPWPDTTWQILDLLEQYGAKATFFTIGQQLQYYPDTVARMFAMGCQICTHTYDHAAGSGQGVNITYMTAEEQIWEILAGYQAIIDMTGVEPSHVIRSPGGNFYGDAIWNLWPYVDAEIGWDIDTEDWSRPGVDSILGSILSVNPGQVILMHDGGGDRSQTVEALRQALPILSSLGYRFVTIDELLAMGR